MCGGFLLLLVLIPRRAVGLSSTCAASVRGTPLTHGRPGRRRRHRLPRSTTRSTRRLVARNPRGGPSALRTAARRLWVVRARGNVHALTGWRTRWRRWCRSLRSTPCRATDTRQLRGESTEKGLLVRLASAELPRPSVTASPYFLRFVLSVTGRFYSFCRSFASRSIGAVPSANIIHLTENGQAPWPRHEADHQRPQQRTAVLQVAKVSEGRRATRTLPMALTLPSSAPPKDGCSL